MRFCIPLRGLFIKVNGHHIIRIEQDSCFSVGVRFGKGVLRIIFLSYNIDFLNKLTKLFSSGGWSNAVGTNNSVVVLLVTIQRSSVPIGTGKLTTSGEDVPQP